MATTYFDKGTIEHVGNITKHAIASGKNSEYAHVVYWENNSTQLRYKRWDGAQWVKADGSSGYDVLFSSGETTFEIDIAVDSNDKPHIIFKRYGSALSDLMYMYYTTGWGAEAALRAPNFDYVKIALDSNDVPHIAFINLTTSTAQYLNKLGGTWSVPEDVETISTYDLSLDIDSNDVPHICYRDAVGTSNLAYSHRTGGSWSGNKETVQDYPNTGIARFDFNLDNNDKPHIVFTNEIKANPKYVNKVSGDWSSPEAISNDTNVDALKLAIGVNNHPYVAFNNNTLSKFATKAAGSWSADIQAIEYGGASIDISIDEKNIIFVAFRQGTQIRFGRNSFYFVETPPVWEVMGEVQSPFVDHITEISAKLKAQIDSSGNVYYVLLADGATAPTSAEVKAGTASEGGDPVAAGNSVVVAHVPVEFELTEMIEGTDYDIYMVAETTSGTIQASPTKVEFATVVETNPILSSLVGWWKFEDGPEDSSGNGFHFTPINYTPVYVDGFVNRAVNQFAGRVNHDPLMNVETFTVEGWFNSLGGDFVFEKSGAFGMYVQQNQGKIILRPVIGGVHYPIEARYSPGVGWNHIAVVYDGSHGIIYVNGRRSTRGSLSGTLNNPSSSLYVATAPPPFGIDEISMYNRALSADEIAEVYATGADGKERLSSIGNGTGGGTNPITQSIIGWWKCEEDGKDSSINANDAVYIKDTVIYQDGVVGKHMLEAGSSGTAVLLRTAENTTGNTELITMEGWFFSKTGQYSIFRKLDCYTLKVTGTQYVQLLFRDHLNVDHQIVFNVALNTDEWYHVAVTYDGINAALYLNGEYVRRSSTSAPYGSIITTINSAFELWGHHGPDEATVYNRVLTDEEIAEIYATGANGKDFLGSVATPLLWEGPTPAIVNLTGDGFDVDVQANKDGNAYSVVVISGSGHPTSTEVKAGKAAGGTDAVAAGYANLTANTLGTISFSDIIPQGKYDVYTVAEDSAGNLQDEPNRIPRVTVVVGTPRFQNHTPYADNITSNSLNVFAQLSEEGTVYCIILPKTDGNASVQQIVAGTDKVGNPVPEGHSGVTSVLRGTVGQIQITNLNPTTKYIVHVVAYEPVNGVYTRPKRIRLTTAEVGLTEAMVYYTEEQGTGPKFA